MNELVKPIQILLIGAESKSHALDMFINRKHLFHVVNDIVNAILEKNFV